MSRDLDAVVPLNDSWDIIYQREHERIYEHCERRARLQMRLSDGIVTSVQLVRDTGDGWMTNVDLGMDDRSDHPAAHRNEIVLEAARAFGLNRDDFPQRDSHDDDNDIIVAEDDSEVLESTDTSDSRQVSFDDIIVA